MTKAHSLVGFIGFALLEIILLSFPGLATAGPPPEKTVADWGGLPEGKGREDVYYTCQSCHSLMLVVQQGMSRPRWQETLEYMVEEQGMTPLDTETNDRILDYLSNHYGS